MSTVNAHKSGINRTVFTSLVSLDDASGRLVYLYFNIFIQLSVCLTLGKS